MSRLGASPAGVYSDDHTKLVALENPDGSQIALPQTIIDAGTIYNFSASNYKWARKALANVKLGLQNMICLCLGDSITVGFDGTNRLVANSYATRLPKEINAQNGNGSYGGALYGGYQNWINDHNAYALGQTISNYDPRVTLGNGWSEFDAPGYDLGGAIQAFNSSTTNPITFAPTVQTDSCDIYYWASNGYSPLTVLSGSSGTIAASTGGTITPSGGGYWAKSTATYTLGSNIWSVAKSVAGSSGLILGMSAYNSTIKEVSFINCAGQGLTLSNLLYGTNLFQSWPSITNPANALTGAPLAILCMGTNDQALGISQIAFYAELITAITGLQAVNTDVLLVCPYFCGPNGTPNASELAINYAYYQAALATNCALIDLNARWGANGLVISTPTNNGLLGADAIHPSDAGHIDIASAINGFFRLLSA